MVTKLKRGLARDEGVFFSGGLRVAESSQQLGLRMRQVRKVVDDGLMLRVFGQRLIGVVMMVNVLVVIGVREMMLIVRLAVVVVFVLELVVGLAAELRGGGQFRPAKIGAESSGLGRNRAGIPAVCRLLLWSSGFGSLRDGFDGIES